MHVWSWRHLPGPLPLRVIPAEPALPAEVLTSMFVVSCAVGSLLPVGDETMQDAGGPR